MSWKDTLQIDKKVTLITSSKDGKPHGIVVAVKGLENNQVLINVCQMKTSLRNLQENDQCCLMTMEDGEYYRIEGTGKLYSDGEYFDLAVERNITGTPEPKFALVISIDAVYDVDKVKKIL